MDLGLRGKKAIVTGGSRGIGLATAQTLADEGVDVAVCARSAESLEAARKDLEGRGGKVVTGEVDVANGDQLKGWIAQAAGELGGLDILISNPSGGNGKSEEEWRANFEVDLMGAVRSVEAALPFLSESDAASVVCVSTTAALETFIGATSYNALKAALVRHASGLAQELGPQGIRVNTISPGPIFIEGGAWDGIKKAVPQMYEGAVKAIPRGSMGTAQEVANAIAFLASPASSLVTGANLVADAGFTKRVNF